MTIAQVDQRQTAGNRRRHEDDAQNPWFATVRAAMCAVVAVAVSLLLILMARVAMEILRGAGRLLQLSPLRIVLARRPFAASFAGSLIGTGAALAVGTDLVTHLEGGSIILIICLLIPTTAPMAFVPLVDPDRAGGRGLWPELRRLHARAGRSALDAGWSEVVVAAGLLLAPPLLASLVGGASTPLALAVLASAMWAVRAPLVDFEHGDSHYGFFRPRRGVTPGERRWMGAIRWLAHLPLALISGRIPYWYAVQHVSVHHAENNGPDDTQSTAFCDRASFAGFSFCVQRFALSGLVPIDVVIYLSRRRRWKALRRLCGGYAIYLAWLATLAALEPRVALAMIFVRYASLVADAASFFQEHGLVDPKHPEAVVTNSLHYINLDSSHGSRGEDPHIEHHLRPGLHWSGYMAALSARSRDYARHRAIGFRDGPGQLRLYFRHMWRRDFAGLADHVSVFGAEGMSATEKAELLASRTAPIRAAPCGRLPLWLDKGVGRVAAWIV